MIVNIRKAMMADAQAIQTLNKNDLGYDYPLTEVKKKLDFILASDQDFIFVAEINQEVVGYIHLRRYELTYAPSLMDIMGIAVSKDYRRQGVGTALLEHSETWAKSYDVKGIRLVSSETRIDAHAFYQRLGYTGNKKQINFKKMW